MDNLCINRESLDCVSRTDHKIWEIGNSKNWILTKQEPVQIFFYKNLVYKNVEVHIEGIFYAISEIRRMKLEKTWILGEKDHVLYNNFKL